MFVWWRGIKPRFPRSNPARLVPPTCLPSAHGLGAARSSHAPPQKGSAIRHKGMRPHPSASSLLTPRCARCVPPFARCTPSAFANGCGGWSTPPKAQSRERCFQSLERNLPTIGNLRMNFSRPWETDCVGAQIFSKVRKARAGIFQCLEQNVPGFGNQRACKAFSSISITKRCRVRGNFAA